MTRRGWGASRQPASGYDNQRLADDVFAVISALKLERPVLVGHSAAGHEMTTLARQHPESVGGLVYLDALGDSESDPSRDSDWMALAQRLPPPAQRAACFQDRSSFAAFRASLQCAVGFTFPESELRNTYGTNADGSVGASKTPHTIHRAMGAGHQGRREIRGHELPFYTDELRRTREATLAELARRDDTWLEAPLRIAPRLNAHWAWFHVAEDEINHRGQIRWLRARLP
jgi:pimeloyl-ACP methyl ester carboxylesterase